MSYHAIQLTGSACQGKNCAAASCAMAIAYGGGPLLTADQVRTLSRSSCIPGKDTPSGGLYISHVVAVAASKGVVIDYGSDPVHYYERWSVQTLRTRLGIGWGAIVLGDYDSLPVIYRAPGSAGFLGDHSTFCHDYRESDDSVEWHDPLRTKAIRVPVTAVAKYWQKPTSPIRGFAGFVRPSIEPPDTSTGGDVVPIEVSEVMPGATVTLTVGDGIYDLDGTKLRTVSASDPKVVDAPFRSDEWVAVALPSTSTPPERLVFVKRSEVTVTRPTNDCSAEIAADRAKAFVAWKP